MSFVFISIPSIARCLKRSMIYSCPCTFYHFLTFLLSLLFYPLQDHRPTEKQKQPLSRLEGTSVVLGGEDEDPVQRPGHHLRGAQLAISLALGMRLDPFDQYEVIDVYRTI